MLEENMLPDQGGQNYKTVSYQKQYNRMLDDVAPFQPVDRDIARNAEKLEAAAEAQADRREQPATDDVER